MLSESDGGGTDAGRGSGTASFVRCVLASTLEWFCSFKKGGTRVVFGINGDPVGTIFDAWCFPDCFRCVCIVVGSFSESAGRK